MNSAAGTNQRSAAGNEFRVAILGGDIGGVSLARSTWEAYAGKPAIIARVVTPFMKYMRRAEFSRLCQRLDIGRPKTVVHRITSETSVPDVSALGWPVIAKAARSTEHHVLRFKGKEKVYELKDQQALETLVQRLFHAGFRGEFIFQRRIAGDDAQMRILTCFVDDEGKVRQSAFGQVIVEEHTPELLGNPAGILTQTERTATLQASKLLKEVGWKGWTNFDIKVDPTDNTLCFFELNPRLGRSNYYLNVSGINPVETLVTALIDKRAVSVNHGNNRGLYTVVLVFLLWRYAAGSEERRAIFQALTSGRVRNLRAAARH